MEEKLAIYGGNPTRKNYLSYGKQKIDEDDMKEVIKVLKSDYLTTGPKVCEFEEKISEYVNSKYAVAFSSGTAALHAACYAAGIKEGDEVITSPITFAASANCILYCNAIPVFADINSETYNIDPEDIEKKITCNTKAIIPVDFTGQSVELDAIKEIARKNKLIVIEDAAHAIGTKYKGKCIGSISDMTVFSFHPVKTITTGEGGMVTTNNEEFYKKLILFRTHGITKDKDLLISKEEGPWYYEQIDLGYNYRITDIQCGLGISQLNKVNEFIKKRKEIVKIYNEELLKIDGIIIQKEEKFSDTSRHLYIIKLELEKFKVGRKEIFEALLAENIGVNVHYLPVYLHPYYKNLGYNKGLCPRAEDLYKAIITLPLHINMTKEDVKDVIRALNKVLGYYKI
ncbi:UDP-4-amino-4,6-dideoxy-N-acetyl-beta-L-altrosamine transaminase [Romboutsia lituseburensis]|uniref:UDP-4-amino-4, 6-dideoxy-N-acetyl-beta-L-altrosamine transaminase n=1 Tax=Romboutsia lituseburensis TaxID=1537 RepID=UPI00215AD376|nr:UDP-4-amino-4,6-dideoxy-N-acetyl-beta-L-altrosamine transaminase [Romboutsia lituseburensis]MCR8744769.1 UDP-4-amino-4,6-dideoxy-N-acetyl-beta-L-altrosamine transaminase [Romboutsia lituseburensis]